MRYRVKAGSPPIADVPAGGYVTREQVENHVPGGTVHFDLLVGAYLEPVPDEPEPKPEPQKKATK
ncbi:MAG TPA: hypothetical protein VIV12_11575 [Streptosporangiaceae bacterium]